MHSFEPIFEPTLQAAQERLAAVDPDAYARTRNALDGAVTRLSPYLTHGLLSLREVYQAVHARHPLKPGHKLVLELGWRAWWRHVWAQRGDGIRQSIHAGPLPDDAYQTEVPADVLEARTGIPVIDRAVRELVATGYVHNHARMWLASYLVHLRKVHWHAGAQWMLAHLLDGDLASNHLSWQWVAGTGSHKPYLFNADNVARFAPAPWHSPGTVIDTSYEVLDRIAHSPAPVPMPPRGRTDAAGTMPPSLTASPSSSAWRPPEGDEVRGRNVWLLHPWALGSVPPPTLGNAVRVGVDCPESHAATPWNGRRWQFVTDGLLASTARLWWGSASELAAALRQARSVGWQPDPHIDPALQRVRALLLAEPVAPNVVVQPESALFEEVPLPCRSFSEWWRRTRLVA